MYHIRYTQEQIRQSKMEGYNMTEIITSEFQEKVEQAILELPVMEYAFFDASDVVYNDRVRQICVDNSCGRYNKSWSCPPAIGTIEECIAKCKKYEKGFIFSTIVEVEDEFDFAEAIKLKDTHEVVTLQVQDIFKELTNNNCLVLSSGCMLCDECAYPNAPCRHPDKMIASVESHGIMIMQVADEHGLCFYMGNNIIIYFGLVLYNEA